MERRKLIVFGKTGFCITIPAAWIKRNKLAKGDDIYIAETPTNILEISPHTRSDDQTLEIDVSAMETDDVVELLIASYLNCYTHITFIKPSPHTITEVRTWVQNLVAAEVMEASAQRIRVQIFWNLKNINLQSVMTRIISITRGMHADTIELLDGADTMSQFNEKRREIKRQLLFARRCVIHALSNSTAARKANLSPLSVLYVSEILRQGENFVDVNGEFAATIAQKRPTHKEMILARDTFQHISKYFLHVFDISHPPKYPSSFPKLQPGIERLMDGGGNAPLLAEQLALMLARTSDVRFAASTLHIVPS